MRKLYGKGPLHLLAHAAALAVAGYALFEIVVAGFAQNFLLWFVGAALLHDLVFLPLYSLLDVLASHGHGRTSAPRSAINYLRTPALLSGLLLLVYFPLIAGLSDRNYLRASGHHELGYLRNWLLLTAGFFVASAFLYALRLRIDRFDDTVSADREEASDKHPSAS
jgi:hypothetical protein